MPRALRCSVSMPAEVYEAIERAAFQRCESRCGWVERVVLEALKRQGVGLRPRAEVVEEIERRRKAKRRDADVDIPPAVFSF